MWKQHLFCVSVVSVSLRFPHTCESKHEWSQRTQTRKRSTLVLFVSQACLCVTHIHESTHVRTAECKGPRHEKVNTCCVCIASVSLCNPHTWIHACANSWTQRTQTWKGQHLLCLGQKRVVVLPIYVSLHMRKQLNAKDPDMKRSTLVVFALQACLCVTHICESTHAQAAEHRGCRHGKGIAFMWHSYQSTSEIEISIEY